MPLTAHPVLPPAIQTQLGLRDPRFRPLSDLKSVLRDLGEFEMDADSVRGLIESGVLVAFNIATDLEGKAELRVLTSSIAFFRQHGGRKYHEPDWSTIWRALVPHSKPIVTGLEIRRALLCDRGHVENLILAGCLKSLQKSRPGPGGSWTVSRDSFERFMKERQT